MESPSKNPPACLYKPGAYDNKVELLRQNPCRVWLSLAHRGAGLADSRLTFPQDHCLSLSAEYPLQHSRMSGSRWVIVPSWLSRSWRSFLYSSSVYSCHLFLISSASVRSTQFLSFIEPMFAWNVPLVSLIFLKRSLVFPILLFSLFLCTDCWGRLSYLFLLFFGTLHSDVYIFPFLLCFLLLFFSQLFVRPPQTAVLIFCISFPWGWSWSLSPEQCHEPHFIVHQALYLSDLGP